jgi:fatty acid amide hydrolase 2
MSDALMRWSAVALADAIRARRLSPLEVVEHHVRRAEAVNPILNAIVQPLYERAIDDARAKTETLARTRDPDTLPRFFGVPCTIKEHFQFAGLPQTGGLLRRRHAIADRDATLVQRMREAGFVPIGTTNVPEALTWHESYNKVYGRTTNAWSRHHSPGGSSGGEGAIVGAGASPIGLGGDIGGSIRIPACFNGTVGHKASGGRVPETGCWPGARGRIARYKVCGPLGRRIEDLEALMPILARPDGLDSSVDGPPWGEAPPRRPESVTVYHFDDNGLVAPTAPVRDAIARTARALGDAGFRVEPWRPTGTARAFEMWANALEHAGGPRFVDVLGDFEGVDLARQWARWPLRRSDHIFPCLALASLEQLVARFPKWGRQMADLRLEMREEIEAKLGDDGVLLCPVFHRTAPRHGLPSVVQTFGFTYAAMINPMELPATSVPVGLAPDGLPLGVQLVGRRHADHLTLYTARFVEAAFGGYRPGEPK